MRPSDAYVAAGLARNPFAWLDQQDPGPFLDRGIGQAPAGGAGLFVQLIGDKGAGKTTTLTHWRRTVPGPYHHVPPAGPGRWLPPPVARVVYWDEVDRMPAPVRSLGLRRAARTRATVVIGTHEDLGTIAARHGFSIRSIELPPIDPSELRRWATDRIDAVRLPATRRVPAPTPSEYDAIAAAAGASWRVAGDLLHAHIASAVTTATSAAR